MVTGWTGCFGTYTYSGNDRFVDRRGDEYIGEWKDGQPHGQGTLTSSNGDKYVGQFENGRPHGQGIKTGRGADYREAQEGIWQMGVFVKPKRVPKQIAHANPGGSSPPSPGLKSEDFVIFFPKHQGFEVVKKIDGSFTFPSPNRLRLFQFPLNGRQPFCAVYAPIDFPEEKHRLLHETLADLLQTTFRDMGVREPIIFDSKDCPSELLWLIQRHSLFGAGGGTGRETQLSPDHVVVVQKWAIDRIKGRFGNSFVEGPLVSGSLLSSAAQVKEGVLLKAQEDSKLRSSEFEKLAGLKSKDKLGSITLFYPKNRGPLRLCTRLGDDEFNLATSGYFATKELPLSKDFMDAAFGANSSIDKENPFTSTFKDLEEIFQQVQQKPDLCQVVVDFPENLKVLIDALKQVTTLKVAKFEINSLITLAEAKSEWAKRRGYRDFDEFEFAKEIGGDAASLKRLASLGVSTRDAFATSAQRMSKQGYSKEAKASVVIQFLVDEAAGAPNKISANRVRLQREKEAEVAERKRAQEADTERKALAKQYPFYAVLSCGLRGRTINLRACFAGGGVAGSTELKIRQGAVEKVYKSHQLGRGIGRLRGDELHIDLENKFSFMAQNASDSLVLTLSIYDRSSDRLIVQREAGSLFGVVSAGN